MIYVCLLLKDNNINYNYIMDQFTQTWETKSQELIQNLQKFYGKSNQSAGTRARKNAQQLKSMLQDLIVNILQNQKNRKNNKSNNTDE